MQERELHQLALLLALLLDAFDFLPQLRSPLGQALKGLLAIPALSPVSLQSAFLHRHHVLQILGQGRRVSLRQGTRIHRILARMS